MRVKPVKLLVISLDFAPLNSPALIWLVAGHWSGRVPDLCWNLGARRRDRGARVEHTSPCPVISHPKQKTKTYKNYQIQNKDTVSKSCHCILTHDYIWFGMICTRKNSLLYIYIYIFLLILYIYIDNCKWPVLKKRWDGGSIWIHIRRSLRQRQVWDI